MIIIQITQTHHGVEGMNAPFSLFTRSTESHHALPMLHSNNLFALGREIRIMHAGEEYRLRLTRNNRLILTK